MSRPAYADVCRAFRWEDSLHALGWTATGSVNLAETIVDRHVGSRRPALSWLGKDEASAMVTYDELSAQTSRFAGLLRSLGVGPGERVAGFLPRIPETLVTMLGTWKAGGIYVPIFTGFGPDGIAFRVQDSGARVLCTHAAYRARVPDLPPGIQIVTVGTAPTGDLEFAKALLVQDDRCDSAPRRRDDPAVLLYTSGSTGPPKGVKIATNFVLAIHPYMRYAVDLQPDDVFWPTGDPGWGYGLVCYMVALAMGVPVICHEASPTAELVLRRLRDLGVTNMATTPTLLRGIMALGEAAVRDHPVRVHAVSSCGEPLNPEVVTFFRRVWDVTVMDQYGSSEFGLPIGNFNAVDMAVKPGSMGIPMPGCRMAVVDDAGREALPGTVGQIGMWPSAEGYYSLGYWQDEERTRAMWRGGWMTIGDLARRDEDGYFWFEGRSDDVIKSAGYRIGPFEVESAILRHPDVAEAAVVGKPDALRGHIVKAYVVLRPGVARRPGLDAEIVELVKTRVGRHQYPREVEFVEQLPKTETGKIQRFLLRKGATAERGDA
jgi:acetyl-CoA synthetase